MVRKGHQMTAVFMDAGHNPALRIPEHKPILGTSLERIKSEKHAASSTVTIGAVQKVAGKMAADSYGLWDISNRDITIEDVDISKNGRRRLQYVANLNEVLGKVKPDATFEAGILGGKPRTCGVIARLHLPSAAGVAGVVVDNNVRRFMPGRWMGKVADYIRCDMPLLSDRGPTVVLSKFSGSTVSQITLDALSGDITMTLSNLCNCVDQVLKPGQGGKPWVRDDDEFKLYYELVKAPRLPIKVRPIPEVRNPAQPSGIRPAQCYRPAQLTLGAA